MEFWKILRILTTNQCNYRCLYCHNEGQIKDDYKENLPFDEKIKFLITLVFLGEGVS